ncbi:MAG: hypothetical protein EXS05_24615 [Planctomycetaceae bacterium]|nr:hypothetical protein [Planctomycetaceae bacterium]
MPPNPDPDLPLNLDLVGYDEFEQVPIIGRATDRESILDLPTPGLPATEPRRGVLREFLTNDFAIGPL